MAAAPEKLPDSVMEQLNKDIEKLSKITPITAKDINISEILMRYPFPQDETTTLRSGITIQYIQTAEHDSEVEKGLSTSQNFLSKNPASFFVERSSSDQIRTDKPIREKDNQDAKSLSLNP